MKKSKLFKSKTQMIVYFIIFFICIFLFIIIGQTKYVKKDKTDAEEFSELYSNVSKDNIYKIIHAPGVLDIINSKSGIILFGFPSNKWTGKYAEILNEVCIDYSINEIYYYDFKQDREINNGTYETIVDKLSMYVPTNDLNHQDIQAPTVLMIKNGEVIAYLDDTSIMRGNIKPDDYYNENELVRTKEVLKAALEKYNE